MDVCDNRKEKVPVLFNKIGESKNIIRKESTLERPIIIRLCLCAVTRKGRYNEIERWSMVMGCWVEM